MSFLCFVALQFLRNIWFVWFPSRLCWRGIYNFSNIKKKRPRYRGKAFIKRDITVIMVTVMTVMSLVLNIRSSRPGNLFSLSHPEKKKCWQTAAGYLLSMSEIVKVGGGIASPPLSSQASLAGNYTPSPLLIKSSASVHQKINTAPRTHPLEWSWLIQN